MSELRDPPRWLESAALSPEVRRDLIAYANVAPGSERRARMLNELEQQIDLTTPAASGGSMLFSGPLKLVAGIAAVCGSLAILAALLTSPAPVRTPVVQVLPPVATSAAASPAHQGATAAQAVKEAVEPAKVDPPARNETVRRRGSVHAAVRAKPIAAAPEPKGASAAAAPADANGALTELVLLARARRALLAHPQRALAFVEEHARTYPQGTFAEEREVLAIESLLRLSQIEQAKTRARAFERRFPQSAHRAHLEQLVSPD